MWCLPAGRQNCRRVLNVTFGYKGVDKACVSPSRCEPRISVGGAGYIGAVHTYVYVFRVLLFPSVSLPREKREYVYMVVCVSSRNSVKFTVGVAFKYSVCNSPPFPQHRPPRSPSLRYSYPFLLSGFHWKRFPTGSNPRPDVEIVTLALTGLPRPHPFAMERGADALEVSMVL